MRLKPKRIRVFPNPWGVHPRVVGKEGTGAVHDATMDAEGRPCGFCHTDPLEDVGRPGRMIGTVIESEWAGPEPLKGEIRSRLQSTGYKFLGCSNSETTPLELAKALAEREPVELGCTGFYVERLLDGSLIAADEATARAAGVPFVDPKVLFPKLAEVARKCFNAQFEDGIDAYAHFCAERAKQRSGQAFNAAAAAATQRELAKDAPNQSAKSENAR